MPEIELTHDYTALLLAAVALIVVIYFFSKRRINKRILKFGNYEILEKVMGRKIVVIGFTPVLLRLAAVVLLVLSVSDPQIIEKKTTLTTDFILAIDTSSSMLAPDLDPNRLEATKDIVLNWLGQLQYARVGVVTFAGKSYVKLKPTSEKDLVADVIRGIGVEEPAGTAIGEALITSAALLSESTGENRTILLITDGRSNVGISINDSLKSIQDTNAVVYTIGIGTRSEVKPVTPSELSAFNATAAEYPDLDESSLNYVAEKTGGKYYHVRDVKSLEDILSSTTGLTERKMAPGPYLLVAGVILLLVEWGLELTRYRPVP